MVNRLFSAVDEIVNTQPIVDSANSRARDFDDLRSILDTLLDAKWLIIAIVLAFLLGGFAYVSVTEPEYEADVVLHIEQRDPKSTGTALDKDLISYGNSSLISSEIEILRSRMVLGDVVDELQLYVDIKPRYFPLRSVAAWLNKGRLNTAGDDVSFGPQFLNFRQYAWCGEKLAFEVLEVPLHLEGQSLILTALADDTFVIGDKDNGVSVAGKVGEDLNLTGLKGGGAMRIRVSELHARAGTQFDFNLSDRTKAISALSSRLKIREQGTESGILKLTLTGANANEAAQTLNKIAQTYLRQNTERHLLEIRQNMEFLEAQLPLVENDLEDDEDALNTFLFQRGSVDLTIETENMLDRIAVMDTELRKLDGQRRDLLVTLTDVHPSVLGLDAQRARILDEIETLSRDVVKMPETQRQILRLNRSVEVNTELYTAMLTRIQELKVVIEGAVGNVRILDRAVESTSPVGPPLLASMSVSAALGLFFGVMVPLLKRSLNRSYLSPGEIETQLSLPVYATILHSSNQGKITRQRPKGRRSIKALAHIKSDDVAIEGLRNLRSSLFFSNREKRSNILQITSASPKVGKSFVSLNLATVMASTGKKVLLVDADLRVGHLHRTFDIPRAPGLSEYLSEKAIPYQIIRPTKISNLWFIPTGERPDNPSELLLKERFGLLIAKIAGVFDYVILDGAPVLAAADAGIIGQIAGNNLLVVKAGTNPIEEIAESQRRLLQDSVKITGVVMNDVKFNRKTRNYSGYVYKNTSE